MATKLTLKLVDRDNTVQMWTFSGTFNVVYQDTDRGRKLWVRSPISSVPLEFDMGLGVNWVTYLAWRDGE